MAKETFKLGDLVSELGIDARLVRQHLRKLDPAVKPTEGAGERGRAAYVFEGKQVFNDVVKRIRDRLATPGKRGPKANKDTEPKTRPDNTPKPAAKTGAKVPKGKETKAPAPTADTPAKPVARRVVRKPAAAAAA